jgi:hypothetical protein
MIGFFYIVGVLSALYWAMRAGFTILDRLIHWLTKSR